MNIKNILDENAIKNIKDDLKSFIKISIVIIIMLLLYDFAFGTVCYTQILFHTPCPFCGITTSLIQLFSFNFSESFNTHPLASLVVIDFIFFIFSKYTKFKISFNILLVINIILFIAVYIYRYI